MNGSDATAPPLVAWRLVLDRRTLPLPVLRPLTVGSDPRNDIQLSHGSVQPFHARLQRHGGAIRVSALDPQGAVQVNGSTVREALLRGGEDLRVGAIALRIERGEVCPAVNVRAPAPPTLQQEFHQALRRELARVPWVLVSVVAHVGVFLFMRSVMQEEERVLVAHYILASIDDTVSAAPLEEDSQHEVAAPEPIEELRDLPDFDVPVDAVEPEVPSGELAQDAVGLGDLRGIGVGSSNGQSGFGGDAISLGRVGGPLKGRLQQFRASGLDLVFLVDTTASMEPFLEKAKATCDRLITDLSALIPNVRLAVIAYRDRGDAYVTRHVPISNDRYAILNFLESLEAEGGGDLPEAVLDAVELAVGGLEWRPGAHRVLLLVADAPPHDDDMARLRMALRGAARGGAGETALSVLYTGEGRMTGGSDEAERVLREVAEYGGGEFSPLQDLSQVVSHIIGMTLGSRYRASAEALLAGRGRSTRAELVARRAADRDLAWLLKKVRIHPVDPNVVEALIGIGSPGVAMRCMDLITDADAERHAREAALYVLRRITPYRGDLDLARPLVIQPEAVQELQRALALACREREAGH